MLQGLKVVELASYLAAPSARELISSADIFLTNMRPAALKRAVAATCL